MIFPNNQSLYQCADFFMTRVASLPVAIRSAQDHRSPQEFIQFCQNLKLLTEAIAIASPRLHKALQKDLKESEAALNKVYFGILKYFLRFSSRATPFGLFSFVWFGSFSEKTNLKFDSKSLQKRARLDMEWIHSLIHLFHKDRELVYTLKIMANPLIFRKGDKIYLDRLNPQTKKTDAISIRNTPITEKIFQLAKRPILYTELETQLFSFFPQYDSEKIRNCLWQIFEEDYFLSELSFCLDHPFCLKEFSEVVSRSSLPIASLLKELLVVIQKYERTAIGEGMSSIDTILEKTIDWKTVEYPLQVDTYYSAHDAHLNHKLQPLIEEVATVIFLLNHQQAKTSFMTDYHELFLEKYGTSRLVPLMELICPTKGLGFPKTKAQKNEQKNDILTLLISQCQAKNAKEITLDTVVKEQLKLTPEISQKAPLSLELYFEVCAASTEEVDKGNYTVIMNPLMATTQAGNTFGRFLYLWDHTKKEELRQFLKKEEALYPEKAFVEASFCPVQARSANVCYFERVREHQLQLHYQKESKGLLDLEDIYIGSTQNRLYLFSKQLDKEIKVCLSTAINPVLAPPSLKLLLDISDEPFKRFSPFIFGDSDNAFYLPRIRYRNVILSPARWHFNQENLGISKDTKPEQLEKILKKAFQTYELPELVFLTEFDNRLLIRWSQSNEFKLILDHFIAKKAVILFEFLPEQNQKPVESENGLHVSEFVVPLVKNHAYVLKKDVPDFPSTTQVPVSERNKWPGASDWLYAKIFLSTDLETDFIKNHLKNYAASLFGKQWIDKWFYIRYSENRSHIRLRLHGNPEVLNGHVLPHLSLWICHLMDAGIVSNFSLHGYEREIERYGGSELIETIENIFCADSFYCAHVLEKMDKKSTDLPLECVAAFGIIHLVKHFCVDSTIRAEFVSFMNQNLDLLKGLRSPIKQMFQWAPFLLNESGEDAFQAIPFCLQLKELLQIVSPYLTAFHTRSEQIQSRIFSTNSFSILNSLIHMHCNRLMGINPELEKKARTIAYFVLSKCSQNSSQLSIKN